MSAGTITLANGSSVVMGVGTAFTTVLAARDFIVATVGGITYTLPVQSVDSDTQVTLISNFPGPTQAGSAWSAVPWKTQQRITAELVSQTTEALRGQNYDKRNWQAVFSASGDITVMLPDGSIFTGPSWHKITELLNSIDLDNLQHIADTVHIDAQQVTTDKNAAGTSADAAHQSASDSASSATSAGNSAADAAGKATEAENAKRDAEVASAAAQQAKADVGNVADAVAAIKGVATLPLGLPFWWPTRATIPAGGLAYDGQEVDQATYPDAYASVLAGTLPVTTEATWQADPGKRHCFTLGATPGKFRVPDLNGATSGSIAQIAMTGGTADLEGIKRGEAPNIKVVLNRIITANPPTVSGAISVTGDTSNTLAWSGGSSMGGVNYEISASKTSERYSDLAKDIHAARASGVICGQMFGRVSNPGSVDGATLATRLENINTDLISRLNATNSRIGHAVIDAGNATLGRAAFFDNPFGNNTAVIVLAELQVAGVWGATGFVYANGGIGTSANYVEGLGIKLCCGGSALACISSSGGGVHTMVPNLTTATPCRIHVYKVVS
ncbi:hypothetical protein [[Enterobacter] lignolyticus]|uniref:Uncharacterized protein n=1 Tax=Enterobacter lignolyticus (strain SCF1) TaxID=701347 RepID=E3G2V7_ENTLS|nr:hypothetical protein [[Enterobacter] lignolyticus]ADO48138.1 hypothetical protein Entcl_1882 [[Enterobacter] lignolyticus SCF1]